MLGFIEGIKNKAIGLAAKTTLGKSKIKTTVKDYIQNAKDDIETLTSDIDSIKELKKTRLGRTLKRLTKKVKHILKDVAKDENLDPIVEIIGNHIGDFKSIEDMQKKLPQKKTVKAMKKFAYHIISVDKYKTLGKLLENVEEFDDLAEKKQKRVLKQLENSKLIEDLKAENRDLNIAQIQKKAKTFTKELCEELKFSKNERNSILELFDDITREHLSDLNEIRNQLVERIPEFLESQKTRILQEYPEFLNNTTKKSKIKKELSEEFDGISAISIVAKPKAKVKKEQIASLSYSEEIDFTKAITPYRSAKVLSITNAVDAKTSAHKKEKKSSSHHQKKAKM